jgi:hypothetical protein
LKIVFFFYKLFIRKEKKTIKLDPTRSFAAPFVGFAFKIEVNIRCEKTKD